MRTASWATLAAKARVNQAAVSYHFKSKDGLYREVLPEAIHASLSTSLPRAANAGNAAGARTRRIHPTACEEAAPFLTLPSILYVVAAVWLVGQCNVFIRHREQLAMPPVSLNLDSALSGLAHANVTVRGPRVLEAEQGSIERG